MQLRKFVLVCSLASFALSNFASALGLGEITLNSTLNEPLNAEVKLVDTRDLSSDQILVALASPADFERNGIDRLYFYTELQFQVLLNNPGGPIVRITTRNSVREPYLNFLLEARWTAGRLLREYTVLMDLPTFDEAVPQPVQAAETSRSTVKETRAVAPAEPVQESQPQPAMEQPAQSSIIDEPSVPYANERPTVEEKPAVIAEQDQSAKKFESGAGTYGPVSKKDTLWEIAKAVRPNSKTSIHQTMLALQRLNPNAFIHGNINLIKKGQVLRVPDANEISSVPKSAAISMVAAQNDAWVSAKASMAANTTELGAQLDASSNAPRDRTQAETVSGRVKLETPLSADAGDGGQGRGAKKGAGKALESELSSTLEELDKSKFEKSELSSRVKDLEEQAKTMQKLTEASNEKLRAMQLNAAKLAEAKAAAAAAEEAKLAEQASVSSVAAVADPVPETVIQPAVVDPVAPIVSAEASSAEASVAASIAASSVSAPVLPEKKARPVVAEKSIVDTVLENLWVVLVAAGFIGVAVFMIRRRKFEEAMPPSRFNSDNEDLYSSEPNFDNFNEEQEQYELEAEPEQEDEMGLFEEDEASGVAETGDVVGEADIYIAYGKFDQAEEMLLNGLAKDPHSSDIRLKLLEVYSQTQNAVEFDKHYAELLPIASEFAKNRASELRANIAGVSAFAAASTIMQPTFSAPPPPAKAEDEFSFDLDDDSTVVNYDKTQIKSSPSNATTQRYSLDFDDTPVAKAKGVTVEDDFSVDLDSDSDFDLDLDTSKNNAEKSEAEDLSEISLALDGLDDDIIDDDLEIADVDEEFSFDFNELDTQSSNLTAKENTNKASQLNDGNTDDFNLELDMNDVDLAALDHEMEGLDADLESLDFDEVKPASNNSTANLVDVEEELDWAEDDDLDLGSTSSLASLNDVPATTAYKTPQSSVDDEIADDVFDQALSDFSADNLNVTDADMSDADLDSELDFMADADESATKLDLARAYIDMGDNEGARDILAEVAHEGNDQQRQEAVDLLNRIDV